MPRMVESQPSLRVVSTGSTSGGRVPAWRPGTWGSRS